MPRGKKRKSIDDAAPSVAASLTQPTPEQIETAKRKFEQGLASRGEAVESGTPLPPKATHEIVGRNADGTPVLKRKRFSLR